MLRIYKKPETFYPWMKHDADYDKFRHEKNENSNFDEYIYSSLPVNGRSLTADITKNKGEKVTTKDLNAAFSTSLVAAMAESDSNSKDAFNSKTANDFLTSLPPEFYTKETFAMVCEKMKSFEYHYPESEQNKLEKNFELFHDFAYKVNPEEIPKPIGRKNIDGLQKIK